ncbi:GreA/GreB family elongation factor [Sphingomonas sp. Mn802worker]|uniref:GreA/GreB family elongation factor n=1 Tax=Sphingomonas sp. Mn802worker TaxID=629773 RepID=UPI0003693831|nr:GreA/GreB family elongation factor [Sphingomonas sp. Mn802worker]
MSVAFRRESDDEHLEPTFELPLPSGPNLVTPRGRALIDERIGALEHQIAATEDAEVVKKLRRDLRYWQTRQVTAVETAPRSDGAVGFGNRVTFTLGGKERRVTLVGDDEADPAAGTIPFSAPLARALMGAEAGEIVAFNGREDAIEVMAVV